jgi:hypothetical protein
MVMAFSTDSDLITLVPDILELGIDSFSTEHAKAENDIMRELRIGWWNRKQIDGDIINAYLTKTQFTRCSAYLVLWKYALPQLTNWTDGDRFQTMIEFYKARYAEELDSILRDGVEYDADNNATITDDEKKTFYTGRLAR